MRQYAASSTFMGLLTRGKFWSIFTPWHISVDLDRRRVDITKRNWYLVSKDSDTFQFSSVRHVKIDESLFGADLHITMYAGSATVRGISKKSAKIIRDMLLDGQMETDPNRAFRERELYNDYNPGDLNF